MSLVHGRDLPKELYKILKPNMKHFNYQWREGVNIDVLPWNPSGSCEPGGLYFTTIDQLHNYAQNPYAQCWVGRVTLDDNEEVWQEQGKWKAHRVFLEEPVRVKDLPDRLKYEFLASSWGILNDHAYSNDPHTQTANWINLAKNNKHVMLHLTRRDRPLIKQIVAQHPQRLKYVLKKVQTHAICMVSVERDGLALRYEKVGQTVKMCMAAVRQNGRALEHVKRQTEEICREAVRQTPLAKEYVSPQFAALFVDDDKSE